MKERIHIFGASGADVSACVIPGAVHSEAAWEKRIPAFFDFLLKEEQA